MKLRVLVVSDQESSYIWDYFDKRRFEGVDVILSCGDLKASYLSFLVTMLSKPLLYVRGNHDARYASLPPEGCIDLEEKPVTVKGVRFAGFGGCKSCSQAPLNYTERAMKRRVEKALRWQRAGKADVLVTHAPAAGLGDEDGGYHEGFECFRNFLIRYKPRYYFHGHMHMNYGKNAQRIRNFEATTIINGYNYYIMDMEFPDKPTEEGRKKHEL